MTALQVYIQYRILHCIVKFAYVLGLSCAGPGEDCGWLASNRRTVVLLTDVDTVQFLQKEN
jgi:hypothetical protein